MPLSPITANFKESGRFGSFLGCARRLGACRAAISRRVAIRLMWRHKGNAGATRRRRARPPSATASQCRVLRGAHHVRVPAHAAVRVPQRAPAALPLRRLRIKMSSDQSTQPEARRSWSWGRLFRGARTLLLLAVAVALLRQVSGPARIAAARATLLDRLQGERSSRVIAMIHRQDTVALFGVPVSSSIGIEDSEAVLRAIRLTPPDQPIDLVLHTPGGLVLAAEQIALALLEQAGEKGPCLASLRHERAPCWRSPRRDQHGPHASRHGHPQIATAASQS